MKRIIISALLFYFAYTGIILSQELSAAKITALSGVAEVAKPDENKKQVWSPAKLQMILNQSDEVRTREGRIELTFDDGRRINLKENTSLSLIKVQDKERKGDTLVKLWIGQIRAKFSIQKEDSTFQVQTKNIVAAVKGTDFIVDADTNGGFLRVIEGIVALIDILTKKELFVKAGEKASYAGAFQGKPEEMNKEEKDKLEEEWSGKKDQKTEEPKKEEKKNTDTAVAPPKEEKKTYEKGGDGLGGSFGAVSVDGKTYYMMSVLFELTLGKFGAGFDMRLLWNDDGIKEDDWQNWQKSLQSIFKYVRYGVKGEPVYLKLGVLDDSTLGHGFLVIRYSNIGVDIYKRVFGLELDIKEGAFGFEGLCNDVSWGRLYAGRLYYDILPNLQAGLTGVYDYNPAKDKYNLSGLNKIYLPAQAPFVAYGADLGYSLIKSELLSILIYADYGVFRNGGEGFALPGLMGNIAIFDYQLEYRSLQSNFDAGIFDYSYEDNRPRTMLPAGGNRLKGVFGQLGTNPVPWLRLVAGYEQYEGQRPYVRGEAAYKGNFIPKISEVAIGYEQRDIEFLTLKSPDTVAYARVGMEVSPGVVFLFTMRQTYDLTQDKFKRSTIMVMQMKF